MNELFATELNVVNIGLASFADNVAQAGGKGVHLDWRPPAGGAVATGRTLAALVNDPAVDEANRVAFARYLDAQPVLVDVVLASEAIPALHDARVILHAGPPIGWTEMCGPMQGAVAGAIVYEGWAPTPERPYSL